MLRKLVPKSEFGRNVVTLLTGSTLAQAIPIAITPILTRIYSHQDFGVLALFVAITMIFGPIANGRYELALMLPDSDEDALNIAALGTAVALTLSLVLLLIVVVFHSAIVRALGNDEIGVWLYLAPFTIFFLGLYNVLNYFNNRLKNYKDIAVSGIYKSLVLAIVQVLLGFFKIGAGGLIIGQILSSVCSNMRLLKNTLAIADVRQMVKIARIKALACRYQDFPKYSMPALLANTLAQNLTNILLSLYYSVATLGLYSLVQRSLGAPTALIGNSISQVYLQQATQERQKTGKAIVTFDNTVKKLLLISVPTFTIAYFFIQDIFVFAFGHEWKEAGVYAQILIPFFAIRFVVSAVALTTSVFEKQRIALVWQIGFLAITVGTLLLSSYYGLSVKIFLALTSILSSAAFIILFFILLRISRGK